MIVFHIEIPNDVCVCPARPAMAVVGQVMDGVDYHMWDAQHGAGLHAPNLQGHNFPIPVGQIAGVEDKGRVSLIEKDAIVLCDGIDFLGIALVIASIPWHLSTLHPWGEGVVDGIKTGFGQNFNGCAFANPLSQGSVFCGKNHDFQSPSQVVWQELSYQTRRFLDVFLLLFVFRGKHIAYNGEKQHKHGQNQDQAGDRPGKKYKWIPFGKNQGTP